MHVSVVHYLEIQKDLSDNFGILRFVVVVLLLCNEDLFSVLTFSVK